jgi:hypothetical protein
VKPFADGDLAQQVDQPLASVDVSDHLALGLSCWIIVLGYEVLAINDNFPQEK